MGLPCTPAYIIAITIGGPALQAMGCDLLASHLFVFYFAILASVTPPVCIAAYCGAAIAGSEPLRTGWEALKLALVGFLIPYVFIYNPALLMQGTVVEIITVFLLLLVSTYFLASGLSNFFLQKLKYWQRVIIIFIGFFLVFINIIPSFYDTIFAAVLIVVGLIFWVLKRINIIKEKDEASSEFGY